MPQLTLLQRIKIAMRRTGVQQNELARRLRVGNSTVSDWFTKDAEISSETMLRLPDALGCSWEWLFYGRGDIAPVTPDQAAAKLGEIRTILDRLPGATANEQGDLGAVSAAQSGAELPPEEGESGQNDGGDGQDPKKQA